MSKYVIQKISQKSRYDLPASLTREIGRIIVRWAHFEQYIQRLIWAVVFLGDEDGAALGRCSIQEPRISDRFEILVRVAQIRKVTFNHTLLKSIKKRSKPACETRDLVAHGIWTDTPSDGWSVQLTRGAWQTIKDGPRGHKRIGQRVCPWTRIS